MLVLWPYKTKGISFTKVQKGNPFHQSAKGGPFSPEMEDPYFVSCAMYVASYICGISNLAPTT